MDHNLIMNPIYIPLPTPLVRYDKDNGDIFTHIGTIICDTAANTEKNCLLNEPMYHFVRQDGTLVNSTNMNTHEVILLGFPGDTLPVTDKIILRYAYDLYFCCFDMANGDSFDLALELTAKDLAIHKITLNMYPNTEQCELRLEVKATDENELCFDAAAESDLPFRHRFETDGKTPEKNEEIIAGRIFREMELILGPFADRLHKKIKVKTKLTKVTSTFDLPSWFDNMAIVKMLLESKSDRIEFVDA